MTSIAFASPEEPLREIALPEANQDGRVALERTLAARRSIRDFLPGAMTPAELAQLLWAGQGITAPSGLRSAPSAGALYPLELHVALGAVEFLPAGVFRYDPSRHSLEPLGAGDRRPQLARAAGSQTWIRDAAAVIAVAAVARHTASKYGERGRRYVYLEAGHIAQNICLQAAALSLGATPVGAFEDHEIKLLLGLASEAEPIYLLPVGRR